MNSVTGFVHDMHIDLLGRTGPCHCANSLQATKKTTTKLSYQLPTGGGEATRSCSSRLACSASSASSAGPTRTSRPRQHLHRVLAGISRLGRTRASHGRPGGTGDRRGRQGSRGGVRHHEARIFTRRGMPGRGFRGLPCASGGKLAPRHGNKRLGSRRAGQTSCGACRSPCRRRRGHRARTTCLP